MYSESESQHDDSEDEVSPEKVRNKRKRKARRCDEDQFYDECLQEGESVLDSNPKPFGSDLGILPSKEIDSKNVPWRTFVALDKSAPSYTDAQLPEKLRETMYPHMQYIMYDDGQGYRYVNWHKLKKRYQLLELLRT